MAKQEKNWTLVCTRIKRLKNSGNGNPQYRLYFDDTDGFNYPIFKSVMTPRDSMMAYKIDYNLIGKLIKFDYHVTPKKEQAILDNFEVIGKVYY